ncbi:acetyltransferase, ribosomal protein N-acetylase [Chthonomonas calidirosea]|uniref:GNAT family N-acetyltransferase n=1 Tax=Chthonomonas calidirosea TaxID=454171 RepID=UPI0006DD4392|nr:GNAT family N-acetyltransferase [Chthonomonas calidirosea]CEK18660.1 acetyltransferase, ribosomal protein N-acetylase [Chthonomonas calidirosea]
MEKETPLQQRATDLSQLRLLTERLLLRPFVLSDAPEVQRLASAPEIADTTSNIPHPYPEGAAEAWIAGHTAQIAAGTTYPFAIILREGETLVGAIDLRVECDHHRAEIGYWIGVPYWRQGYATEAVRRVIAFGFDVLNLNRIYATYFTRNSASRRVMEKAGMHFEGVLREWIRKAGRYEDCGICAILRKDYKEAGKIGENLSVAP